MFLLYSSKLRSKRFWATPTWFQSINQSIKTHLYSAMCREWIRGAWCRRL